MDVASSRGLYEAKTYELHGLEGISTGPSKRILRCMKATSKKPTI